MKTNQIIIIGALVLVGLYLWKSQAQAATPANPYQSALQNGIAKGKAASIAQANKVGNSLLTSGINALSNGANGLLSNIQSGLGHDSGVDHPTNTNSDTDMTAAAETATDMTTMDNTPNTSASS